MKLAEATKEKYDKAPVFQGVLQKFPRALEAVARCSEFGAKKHGSAIESQEFMDVPDATNVYANALARHILAEGTDGLVNKEDGNMLHAAQAAWNALARLECLLLNS